MPINACNDLHPSGDHPEEHKHPDHEPNYVVNQTYAKAGHWYLLSLGFVIAIGAIITTYIVYFRRTAD